MAEEFNNPINKENIETEVTHTPAKEKFVIRPLRTYEEDVANFVKRGQISTAKIIAAEQKRQTENAAIQDVDNTKKKIVVIIGASIGLVVLAGLILWGVFSYMKSDNNITDAGRPGNFRDILINKKQILEISTDNKVGSDVKTKIVQFIKVPPSDLGNSEIAELLITKTAQSIVGKKSAEVKQKISIQDLFGYLELNPGESFMRALDQNYLFGLINLEGDTFPFILIKTLEYERVFSGLLNWERTLYREINDIFFKTLGTNDFVNLSGDNSAAVNFDPSKFVDKIFYNRDVRAITNNDDKVLFYYTFVNNSYVLLSSKVVAIQDLAAKLNLQNIVR
jgi:hypothetical protein